MVPVSDPQLGPKGEKRAKYTFRLSEEEYNDLGDLEKPAREQEVIPEKTPLCGDY